MLHQNSKGGVWYRPSFSQCYVNFASNFEFDAMVILKQSIHLHNQKNDSSMFNVIYFRFFFERKMRKNIILKFDGYRWHWSLKKMFFDVKMYTVFIVFFHLPMSIISKLLWVPQNRTVLTGDGKLITVESIRFKKTEFPYFGRNYYSKRTGMSKRQCGEMCMNDARCVTWSSNGDTCMVCATTFLVSHEKTAISEDYSSYEIMVSCGCSF